MVDPRRRDSYDIELLRHRRTMVVSRWALVGSLLACGSEPRPEGDLGGLLHAEADEARDQDITRVGSDLATLGTAIARPHSASMGELGGHRWKSVARSEIEGGARPQAVTTTTELAVSSEGRFSATAHNEHQYGREAIFDGTSLYLRPRFGKFHKRAPESDAEPVAILDELSSAPAAYFELLAPGLAIKSHSEELIGGRSAIQVVLETASAPAANAPETLTQRKWRESRKLEAAKGILSFDRETGALLEAELEGRVSFVKDGQSFTMALSVKSSIEDIGKEPALEIPAAEATVSAPTTLAEVDERDELLRGIAPPARRGRTPDNPTGDAVVAP